VSAVRTDAERLRTCWTAGRTAIGLWSVLADPVALEIVGAADADVVCVDAQHGLTDVATLPSVLAGLRVVGRVPMVRVRWNEPGQIMRALDAGAAGVVVPMVSTAADAQAAVAACRFPPRGVRSWGPLWGARPVPDPQAQDQAVLCAVMVETADAVANLDQILAVPGLDAVYIGPNDLALSCGLGRATYRTSPEVDALLRRVVEAARAAGVPVGLHCSDVGMAAHWRELGVSWVTAATDADLLGAGLRAELAALA
jgi:4-hydroxy-2-oxoheptanedioate aldolase